MLTNPTFYFVFVPVVAWMLYGFWLENKQKRYNGKTLVVALVCNAAMALDMLYCYRIDIHKQLSHPTLLAYAYIVWASTLLRSVIAFRQIGKVRTPSEWSLMGAVLAGVLSMAIMMPVFLG